MQAPWKAEPLTWVPNACSAWSAAAVWDSWVGENTGRALAQRDSELRARWPTQAHRVTLTPQRPEVGRPHFQAACKMDSLNLFVRTAARIHCNGGGAGN